MNSKTDFNDIARRLNSIIETAIDGIITIDDRGTVESMNPAAAQLFEYLPREVIGQNIKMLMPEPYHSEHDGYIHRYNKTKEPRIIGIGREVRGKKKNGTIFSFRLGVSEVILNDRVIFTGIIHDLTDVKEVQSKLENANAALESKVEERTQELEDVVNELLRSNRLLESSQTELEFTLEKEKELSELKSRFVSMASHEFRTPLSTILSSASLIAKYQESDQQDKRGRHIDRIKSAVANLTGILNDFLSLSKLEEGKVEVNVQESDISVLCADVSDELKSILKEGQVINKKTVGSERPLLTDIRILKNILFNLISNAIKYSPKGEEIGCTFEFKEDTLIISIADKGVGIPVSEQQYLFERFFRATNVENIQGTGLGLNIVKRYVSLLKGSITFESQENVGTTFIVTLPIEL